MGRCLAKPIVKIVKSKPPELENFKVFYQGKSVGEIFASFELVLVKTK